MSIGATVGAVSALAFSASYDGEQCQNDACGTYAAGTIGGIVLFAAGIPMVVIGGKKVPVNPETPPKTSFSPELILSPTSASFRLAF
jgi:hypothetical protein